MRCAKLALREAPRTIRVGTGNKTKGRIVSRGRTDVGLAKEASALSRGRRGRGTLNLRRRGRARLAHAVGSVHIGGGVLAIDQVWIGGMYSCLKFRGRRGVDMEGAEMSRYDGGFV